MKTGLNNEVIKSYSLIAAVLLITFLILNIPNLCHAQNSQEPDPEKVILFKLKDDVVNAKDVIQETKRQMTQMASQLLFSQKTGLEPIKVIPLIQPEKYENDKEK